MSFAKIGEGPILEYTWATLPAAASMKGMAVRVTDVGVNGSTWISDGSKWVPISGIVVLAQSGLAIPAPANTSENTLVENTIKGGVIGANGIVKVEFLFSNSNSANNKAVRVKIGSTSLVSVNQTTNVTGQGSAVIRNSNSASSQKAYPSAVTSIYSVALATASVDTTQNFTVSITGALANSSDTLTLEGYIVILYSSN